MIKKQRNYLYDIALGLNISIATVSRALKKTSVGGNDPVGQEFGAW